MTNSSIEELQNRLVNENIKTFKVTSLSLDGTLTIEGNCNLGNYHQVRIVFKGVTYISVPMVFYNAIFNEAVEADIQLFAKFSFYDKDSIIISLILNDELDNEKAEKCFIIAKEISYTFIKTASYFKRENLKEGDEFVKDKAFEDKILLPSGLNENITSTSKGLPKRKKYHSNLLRLGSVAVILGICVLTGIGFVSPSFASYVRNVSHTISSNISDFLGLQRNLAKHETVINKEITDNSITVKLNEAILDGNKLTVSYNISPNIYLEKYKNLSWPGFNYLSVNGKEVNGRSGAVCGSDDNTIYSVTTYDLGNTDLSGDLDIKLLSSAMSMKDKENKASWDFEFKIKGYHSSKEILFFVAVALFILFIMKYLYGVWITRKTIRVANNP